MKTKTSKSVSKRIRITRRGKIIRRKTGVDHFRTKKTSKNLAQKRKTYSLDVSKKTILNY